MLNSRFYASLVALLTVGCTVEAPLGSDNQESFHVVVDTPARLRNQVDLLFVIDNSESMAARQLNLSSSLNMVFAQLEFGRGMPDLHIGVVTTDMGIGEFGTPDGLCSQSGQNGQLKIAANECGIGDDFLAVRQDIKGSLIANISGDITTETLATKLSCMVERGETGCEYEQPLKAMRKALSAEGSRDFLRPDAVLTVVLMTDEDDCSAYNPQLFAPENPQFRGDDPNFRCFQSGVICDGDDVYQPGQRDGCRPRTDSDYVSRIDTYVDFLTELKPNPQDRIITAIIGDPSDVAVRLDKQDDAELLPTCEDANGAVYPGIRMSAFVESFSEQGIESSLCQTEQGQYAGDIVRKIRESLGTSCLKGPIRDVDTKQPGRQIDCFVYEQIEEQRETRRYFEKCDNLGDLANSSILPCYAIHTGGESCDTQTQLTLQIFGRDSRPDEMAHTIAECR